MVHADLSYPIFPIANIICAALLLLLLTRLYRQAWNLGLTILSFWLFWNTLFSGIDAIIWADNADVKLYGWYDLTSHVEVIVAIAKPACSLLITRRLFKVISEERLLPEDLRKRRFDLIFEICLGVIFPLICAGPFYYIVQRTRFEVDAGFGCGNHYDVTGMAILLLEGWKILFPLIAVCLYCSRILFFFFRRRRAMRQFLHSNSSMSHGNFYRFMFLGSLDIFFSLPFGIASLVFNILKYPQQLGTPVPFYLGWTATHGDPTWAPLSSPPDTKSKANLWGNANIYIQYWSCPILGLAIFGVFGMTSEAIETYKAAALVVLKRFGYQPRPTNSSKFESLRFKQATQTSSGSSGSVESMSEQGIAHDSVFPQRLVDKEKGKGHSVQGTGSSYSLSGSSSSPHSPEQTSRKEPPSFSSLDGAEKGNA